MVRPKRLAPCILFVHLLQALLVTSRPYSTPGLPPGHWDLEHKRWNSTAPDFKIRDLIGFPAPATDSPDPTAVHGIFFGDSNDRNLLNDFCLKEEPQIQQRGHDVEVFKSCWHRNLTLSWQALIGIHPTGPYWGGKTGTPHVRLVHGFQTLQSQIQRPPDFLVASSNLWDLWRWGASDVTLLANKKIASHELSAWEKHLSLLLDEIEAETSKETLLIFRTGAAGSWGACADPDGTFPLPHHGVHKQHMYQLNAVAKGALSQRPRWHLLDMEMLLGEFDCPQHYLRDYIHTSAWVNWNLLNLYINMLTSHWHDRGLPSWRQSRRHSIL